MKRCAVHGPWLHAAGGPEPRVIAELATGNHRGRYWAGPLICEGCLQPWPGEPLPELELYDADLYDPAEDLELEATAYG